MKLRYIDALRGIAVLLVIMVHSFQTFELNKSLELFFDMGAKGVQLFFVASAFTLFLSINHRKKTELNYVRNFFIRRFFRIAPMYYLGVLYFTITGVEKLEIEGIISVISNVFFMHGLHPNQISSIVPGGWSIAVEMMFYLLVPLLAKKIKNTNAAVVFTLFVYVFSMFFRIVLEKYPIVSDVALMHSFIYSNLINQLPVFGLGIISYFLIIRKDYCINKIYKFFILFLVLSHLVWNIVLTRTILFSICWLFLVYLLSQKEFFILVNRFTMFMGKISYSMYLVHFAVLHEIRSFVPKQYSEDILFAFLFFIITILISSIISRFTHYLIETNFQEIGKKIILRLDMKKE
ncbi:acyltransferase family protein [Wenyingzhuangia sp. IMCC45574]